MSEFHTNFLQKLALFLHKKGRKHLKNLKEIATSIQKILLIFYLALSSELYILIKLKLKRVNYPPLNALTDCLKWGLLG
ncbi:hypothetical protein COF09_30695 [Bacillus toyonensis]|nr:hypothetical protein COF09_30695 [Bacillus toyonensis]